MYSHHSVPMYPQWLSLSFVFLSFCTDCLCQDDRKGGRLKECMLIDSDKFTDQRGWKRVINKHLHTFLVGTDTVIQDSKADGSFLPFSLLVSAHKLNPENTMV